jgi:hypothetical protein
MEEASMVVRSRKTIEEGGERGERGEGADGRRMQDAERRMQSAECSGVGLAFQVTQWDVSEGRTSPFALQHLKHAAAEPKNAD